MANGTSVEVAEIRRGRKARVGQEFNSFESKDRRTLMVITGLRIAYVISAPLEQPQFGLEIKRGNVHR